MWFPVRTTNAALLDRARRQRFTYDIRIDAPADLVFEVVSDPSHFAHWVPGHRESRWLSEGPPGRGSQRLLVVDRVSVKEEVVVWEPGRQLVASVSAASVPFARSMVQQCLLTPAPGGGCRLQWSIAYRARAIVIPFFRWVQPRFATIFQQGSVELKTYATALHQARAAAAAPETGAPGALGDQP